MKGKVKRVDLLFLRQVQKSLEVQVAVVVTGVIIRHSYFKNDFANIEVLL